MKMNREQEAISRLCLLLGALHVLAPKDNQVLQDILRDTAEWLNPPTVTNDLPGSRSEWDR